MTQYLVYYQYRGSARFDSPLYRREERMRFASYREAAAWADAEHPHLPEYKTLGIYTEEDIVIPAYGCGMTASERARTSDRDTDMSIALGTCRFR